MVQAASPSGRGHKRPPDISRCGLRPSLPGGAAWWPLAGDSSALVLGELEDVGWDLPVAQVRDRHVLQDPPKRGADRDPDLAELLGVARVLGLLRGLVLDVRKRPFD